MQVEGTTTLDEIFSQMLSLKAESACETLGIEQTQLLEAFGLSSKATSPSAKPVSRRPKTKKPVVQSDDEEEVPRMSKPKNNKKPEDEDIPAPKSRKPKPAEAVPSSADTSRCGYVMTAGKRAGEKCGKPARTSFSGIGACSVHEKKVEQMSPASSPTDNDGTENIESVVAPKPRKPKNLPDSKTKTEPAILKKIKADAPTILSLKKYKGKFYAEIDGVKVAFDAKTKKAIGHFNPGTDDLEESLSQRQVEAIEAMGHYVDESVEIKTYKKEKHAGSDGEDTEVGDADFAQESEGEDDGVESEPDEGEADDE